LHLAFVAWARVPFWLAVGYSLPPSQLTLGLWSGPESPPSFHPIALSSQHISEIPGVFTDPDHRKQKSKRCNREKRRHWEPHLLA
jgi:hypothetical protein